MRAQHRRLEAGSPTPPPPEPPAAGRPNEKQLVDKLAPSRRDSDQTSCGLWLLVPNRLTHNPDSGAGVQRRTTARGGQLNAALNVQQLVFLSFLEDFPSSSTGEELAVSRDRRSCLGIQKYTRAHKHAAATVPPRHVRD